MSDIHRHNPPSRPIAAPSSVPANAASLAASSGVIPHPLAEIYTRIVQDVQAVMGVSRCALAILEPATGTLLVVKAVGAPCEPHDQGRTLLGQGLAGWVAAHRQPLLIHDAAHDPRMRQPEGAPIGSVLCMPIITGKTIAGVITVAGERMGAFDGRSQAALEVVVRYAAQALGPHSVTAENDSTRQLALIVEAARTINSLLAPNEVFTNIARGIGRLIEYDDALILAYDASTDDLQVMAGQGRHSNSVQAARVSMRDTASLSVRVAHQRHAYVYAPKSSLPQSSSPESFLVEPSAPPTGHITESFLGGEDLALLCVPLLSKEILRGVVTLARQQPFTPDDLRSLTDLSPLIATALENVSLYAAVAAEQQRLAAIFAATAEGIIVVDDTGRLVQANAAFAHLVGRPSNTLVGMSFAAACTPPGATVESIFGLSRLITAISTTNQTGEMIPLVECAMPGKEITPRQVLASVSPITTPVGGKQAVVVLRDVTELRAVDRVKAQFLQMVAHEIRSPLHTLNGYLDIARMTFSERLEPHQQDVLRHARDSARTLSGRINDLLLLAHADAGYSDIDLAPMTFERVIASALNEVALAAEEAGVTMRQTLPPGLPMVLGDGGRLQQLVRNLLGNAIKFTPSGGSIAVEVTASPGVFAISVSDTGCGIATAHLPQIFERFYQVPPETGQRKPKGQGLGLAIVKMIAEQHGGWMHVTSTPGQGSRFIAHLPLHPATE